MSELLFVYQTSTRSLFRFGGDHCEISKKKILLIRNKRNKMQIKMPFGDRWSLGPTLADLKSPGNRQFDDEQATQKRFWIQRKRTEWSSKWPTIWLKIVKKFYEIRRSKIFEELFDWIRLVLTAGSKLMACVQMAAKHQSYCPRLMSIVYWTMLLSKQTNKTISWPKHSSNQLKNNNEAIIWKVKDSLYQRVSLMA